MNYDIFIHPRTGEALRFENNCLIGVESGERFDVRNGIFAFLKAGDVRGKNERYQKLYDKFAPFYNFISNVVCFFWRDYSTTKWLNHYLDTLKIQAENSILEVSIGTGINLKFLPKGTHYYGLDVSSGMLRQCRKNLAKWGVYGTLVQGLAEYLPFKDNSFDAVFHVGGINFFSDKARALAEMVRVAKPGAKFIIIDETEKAAKAGEKQFLTRRFFKNRNEVIEPPVGLLPPGMLDVKMNLEQDENFYVITFRKP